MCIILEDKKIKGNRLNEHTKQKHNIFSLLFSTIRAEIFEKKSPRADGLVEVLAAKNKVKF